MMADTKPVARRASDTAGSRYALEVAFRTMQKRCQKLQERLSVLEEENTRLRVSEMQDKKEADLSGSQMRSLRDVIAQLELEKKQLSHHVYMVTSENKHLWNCLSQSRETNEIVRNQLTLISDAFIQHPLNRVAESQIIKKAPSILLSHSTSNRQSPINTALESEAKDSLEEISLKLINSFLQEKSELEDQFAQMVVLHDSDLPLSFSTENLSQSLLHDIMSEENGASLMLTDIKEQKSTLLLMKDDLMNQQRLLQSAIDNLKQLKEERTSCPTCKLRAEDFEKHMYPSQETAILNPVIDSNCEAKMDNADSYSEPVDHPKQAFTEEKPSSTGQSGTMYHSCGYVRNMTTSTEAPQSDSPSLTTSYSLNRDNVCPLCGKVYCFSASFKLFIDHVDSHFEDEDFHFIEGDSK